MSADLIHRIAAILDHPSVFMGGPSRQSLQKAEAIATMLAEDSRAAVSAGKVMALSDAYEAGARAVHQKWLRAHKAGEGPSRGDPEFGEAATDYAAFAAVYAQALKDQGETRAKLVQAETALAALQPGDGWQDISSAKLDRSQMIVAVPDQHRTGWIVGEAYYDPEAQDWFWAGTGVHGVDCGPISEANHWLPELWQPMSEPSAPPASLPLGEETR